jgi:hypothetical protein
MLKNTLPTLFALLLAALPAYAQFEGVLEMKMTMATKDGAAGGGGGTMNIAVAKAGTRCEMNMQMGGMGMKMVMLQKADTPNTLYRINDANKTYTEVDLAKMQAMAGQPQDSKKYTVEKLGQETLLGYKTQHVLVKDSSPGPGEGATTEMWTAKDLLDYATFSKMQARPGRGGSQEAMVKALKDAGADGLPLKSIMTTGDGSKVTMEVVKVDKRSLPASTFGIPAGYSKSAGGIMDMMGGMSGPQGDDAKKKMDDAQKRMDEALKKMSPEQREMMEKMMKQRKAGSQ